MCFCVSSVVSSAAVTWCLHGQCSHRGPRSLLKLTSAAGLALTQSLVSVMLIAVTSMSTGLLPLALVKEVESVLWNCCVYHWPLLSQDVLYVLCVSFTPGSGYWCSSSDCPCTAAAVTHLNLSLSSLAICVQHFHAQSIWDVLWKHCNNFPNVCIWNVY